MAAAGHVWVAFEPLHGGNLWSAKGARAKPFRRNAKVRLWPTIVVLQAMCHARRAVCVRRLLAHEGRGTLAAFAGRRWRCAMPQPEKVLARIQSLDERLA